MHYFSLPTISIAILILIHCTTNANGIGKSENSISEGNAPSREISLIKSEKQPGIIGDNAESSSSLSALLRHDKKQEDWQNDEGFWNVTNLAERQTCILFRAAIQFDINYYQTDGERYVARIDMPSSAEASGNCEDMVQFMELIWPVPLQNETQLHGSIRIYFDSYYQEGTRAPAQTMVAVSRIKITYPATNLPNARDRDEILIGENKNLNVFSVPLDNSFKCEFQELISENDFTIRFSGFQYQAFMEEQSDPGLAKFYTPVFCDPPKKPISTTDIFIGLAVAGALFGIAGFIFWHRKYKKNCRR